MKKFFILFLILLPLILNGCNKSSKDTIDSISNITEKEKKTLSNYTGLPINEINDTDFLVMVENSQMSRPQSGLSYADIIYETSAEGGIPRFMALFSSNLPEKIGPVRSVRQYFIDISVERSLPFAHCGGSEEALVAISTDSKIMSINEIPNGNFFYRDASRKAPHNLYTSSDNIKNFIKENNFNYTPNSFLNFSKTYFDNDSLSNASDIDIKVNRLYTTSYKFENNKYTKYMDGTLALDALNNKPLTFDNIVIQKTDIVLKENRIHLNIDLIGKGTGYVLSKGKYIEVIWEKNHKSSQTKLYDSEGNEIKLSPGNTIWNIIDNNSSIIIN